MPRRRRQPSTPHGATVLDQEYVPEFAIADMLDHPENPRLSNAPGIGESIDHNGFYGSVLIQRSTGYLIYGHGRKRAALDRGMTHLPALIVDVDDDRARRILLVDNKSADDAGYDNDKLVALLTGMDSESDLLGTLWSNDDLELLRGLDTTSDGRGEAAEIEDDEGELVGPSRSICEPGDLWILGDHRVLCGDCRDDHDVARLLDGEALALAFTSPPYADRREYDEASGFRPIPPEEYVEWFRPVAENVANNLLPDGSWCVNIKAGAEGLDRLLYVFDLVIAHVREWGWHYADEFCWERVGVPKRPALRLKGQFEPIYQFARDRWKFRPDNVMHMSDAAITPDGIGGHPSEEARQGQPNSDFFGTRRGARTFDEGGNVGDNQGEPGATTFDGDRVGEGLAYPGNRLPTFSGSHEAVGHSAAFPIGLPASSLDC